MTEGLGISIASLGAGAMVGAVYFLLLWYAVRALTERRSTGPRAVALFGLQAVARLGVVAGSLFLALLLGATLAQIGLALLGFLTARHSVSAVVGRRSEERS